MKKLIALIMMVFALAIANANTVSQFAYFTNNAQPYPESIARDSCGNLYLPLTFGQSVHKVDSSGNVTTFATIPADYLLGAAFDPSGNLIVVSGVSGLWKITPTGVVSKYSDVTGFGTLNDLVFDDDGYCYVTDDTLNLIWKVAPNGTSAVWSEDPLFDVVNHENFPWDEGCNGIAISKNDRKIFVTNTSDGIIIEIGIRNDGTAKPGVIFAQDDVLVGADGIKMRGGNAFIVNNLDNAVLKVKKNGGGIVTLASGGLLNFPTGIVLSDDRKEIFIANSGDAFFGTTTAYQGVLLLDLRH